MSIDDIRIAIRDAYLVGWEQCNPAPAPGDSSESTQQFFVKFQDANIKATDYAQKALLKLLGSTQVQVSN